MLRIPDAPPLTLLRDFLIDAGYRADRLGSELGLSHTLYADFSNLQPLLERTSGETKFAVLARLFFIGWPSSQELCRRQIPKEVLQLCLHANILAESDGEFSPNAIIVPFEGLLLACDAPRLRANQPDVVLGPSATTGLLAKAALRTSCDSVLDIGTGTGVLAMLAADFGDHVVGTDVNERAIAFARFNTALNGIQTADFLVGDAFAPVNGTRFARILANPPFFLSAKKHFVYSDSPLELDGFARKLTREAPHHLKEGGVFQMICEWVQVEGERWQQRLQSWAADSGCDVFILLGPKLTPVDYAEKRFLEAALLYSTRASDLMSERLNYLRQNRVECVMSGIFTMRKRTGVNWFTAVAGDLIESAPRGIQQRMAALTWLNERTADQCLQARLRLTPDTVIKQTSMFGDNGWQTSVQISKTDGIDDALNVDLPVLRTIEMFDGSLTLQQIIGETAKMQGISIEDAKTKCFALSKRLLKSSFILPVEIGGNQK